MKENIRLFGLAIIVFIISLSGMVFCELFWVSDASLQCREIVENILMGMLASSLLLIPTSIIGYKIEKKRVKNSLITQLSLLRLNIKDILVDSTVSSYNGYNEIALSLDRDFKDRLVSIDIGAISIVQCLNEIPSICNLFTLRNNILSFCSKINSLTEKMQNIIGKSKEQIDVEQISQDIDISKLNNIIENLKII